MVQANGSLGYEFANGKIIRKDNQFLHSEVVRPALALLSSKLFEKANDEFLKAYEHYALGLPAMLAGLWLGFKFYGKLDDVAFRKVVLLLLLLAGLALIAAQGWPLLRSSPN